MPRLQAHCSVVSLIITMLHLYGCTSEQRGDADQSLRLPVTMIRAQFAAPLEEAQVLNKLSESELTELCEAVVETNQLYGLDTEHCIAELILSGELGDAKSPERDCTERVRHCQESQAGPDFAPFAQLADCKRIFGLWVRNGDCVANVSQLEACLENSLNAALTHARVMRSFTCSIFNSERTLSNARAALRLSEGNNVNALSTAACTSLLASCPTFFASPMGNLITDDGPQD